jgi:hypothetical protein
LGLGLVVGSLLGAAPASAQNRFNLVNSTNEMIERAYVSSSRDDSWGPDVLGTNVLPAGDALWIDPSFDDCEVDIRVVFQGGRSEERRRVNACSLSRVVWGNAAAGGGDPSFQFVNDTGGTVFELFVSLSSDSNWGEDRLGANTLAPGEGNWIALPSGKVCTVDIRVVFPDGRAQEQRGIETCTQQAVNFR